MGGPSFSECELADDGVFGGVIRVLVGVDGETENGCVYVPMAIAGSVAAISMSEAKGVFGGAVRLIDILGDRLG